MRKLSKVVMTLVMVAAGASAWAGVPEGKETLSIDLIPGKKGAVSFPHADHDTKFKSKDGSKIECKDCHHMVKGDATPKPCSECHAKMGEAEKDIGGKKAPAMATAKGDKADSKSIIFHKRCKDACHKEIGKTAEGKKLTSCKTCHKK